MQTDSHFKVIWGEKNKKREERKNAQAQKASDSRTRR
jgi:hypothetical protein